MAKKLDKHKKTWEPIVTETASRHVKTGSFLSAKDLTSRKTKCEENSLCFVSMHQLDETTVEVEHPAVGTVKVLAKYSA